MKTKIAAVLMVIICFILQSTVFQTLAFGDICPNLLIILTASFGFMHGRKYGMIVGFFCGLLNDIFFGSTIGLQALIFMYIGYGNGLFHSIFYQNDIKLPLVLILASDFIHGIVYYLLKFLLNGRFDIGYYITKIIFPEIIYTIAIAIIFYPIILWTSKLCNTEKGSDQ